MNSAPYPTAGAGPPAPVCTAASAWSIGSHAADSTSQVRKISTPTAAPFNTTRTPGAGRDQRLTGNPSKMVTPAMRPSSSV